MPRTTTASIGIVCLLAIVSPLLAQEPRERPEGDGPEPATAEVPPADEAYELLLRASRDTTRVPGEGGGPIEYRGDQLLFYPEGEVILLEGQAEAEQAGTRLRAKRILFRSSEGVVEAFGEAAVQRGPSELRADSLFYDRTTETVATYGASTLSEGTSVTEGIDLQYDLERRSGRLGAGVTTYAPWILLGEDMEKIGDTTYLVEEGYFTTCNLEEPHYTFRSDEIKLRQEDVIVASPVILYFSDIPVFYLPWYVEPVVRGRHSGFLRPQIGINTLIFGSGRERSVQDLGYYYVINDYADAAVGADWYTESRFILRFDARYNLRYEFQGDLHYESVWNRLEDSRSQLVHYRHDHTFSQDSRANVDINWSNRSFLRQNSFDPEEILQRAFRSAASYSRRFSWGSLIAGGDADFRLDANRTDLRIPDIRLSINQRPLWGRRTGAATEGQPWWRVLQYSASTSFLARLSRAQLDSLGNPLTSIPTDSLGNEIEGERETFIDEQQANGRFTLNGPLNLYGVLKASPSMTYSLQVENDELAEDEQLGGRGQLSAGLSMSSKFFRIFSPPFGPFSRARHTVSPSVSFSYSPKPDLFGAEDTSEARESLRETLTASVSLGQDIDVKIPVRGEDSAADEDRSRSEDPEAEVDEADAEQEDEPVETRTVNLLNITNSFSYDFVRAREPDQLGFGSLSTRLTTGLGRGFSVSTTLNHDLVKEGEAREIFDPFLQRITTDFSIRGGGSPGIDRRTVQDESRTLAGRGSEESTEEAREVLVEDRPQTGFGPWSLSLTHSWTRTRGAGGNRQSLGIGASLLPSSKWSLNYRTTYDVSERSFQAQTLALVRDLHDWQATLGVNIFPAEPQDRVLVSFSVYLRDVPDLELPYRVRRE